MCESWEPADRMPATPTRTSDRAGRLDGSLLARQVAYKPGLRPPCTSRAGTRGVRSLPASRSSRHAAGRATSDRALWSTLSPSLTIEGSTPCRSGRRRCKGRGWPLPPARGTRPGQLDDRALPRDRGLIRRSPQLTGRVVTSVDTVHPACARIRLRLRRVEEASRQKEMERCKR
jgi:hypothetical protein